jgi:hypothetical protein
MYPLHCAEPVPGAKLTGVTEPSCDSGGVMNGSPCDISDDFPWSCQVDVELNLPNGETAINSYDLKGLCKNQGYDWVDKGNNAWFNVNVCGYAPKQCFPADCAADGVLAEDNKRRTWTGAPCTPWSPTANVGSVVRFFQDNLDPAPTSGTKGHNGESQSSCFTDDNQVVDCSEACTVPATSMYNEMGVGVNWGVDVGGVDGFSGLVLTGSSPGTEVNVLDPSNPLGPNATGGQTCQPTSEFPGGVQFGSFSFVCEEGLQGAEIVRVDTIGCTYEVVMKTGAVCPGAVICPPGTGMCANGPNAGWCSADCQTIGFFWVCVLIVLAVFAAYCLVGACVQRRITGEFLMPHEPFWSACITCKLCRGEGGAGSSSFQQLFGRPKAPSLSGNGGGTNAFSSMDHPDLRKPTYGSVRP